MFIAYSRNDADIRNRIDAHLTPMKKNNLIETWYDGLIVPGEVWNDEIKKYLEISDIILLLISIDFIASDYCYNVEMERALKRHDNAEAVVIPILVSHCDWKETPISKLQILPRKGLPVSSWNDKDEILTTIAHEIKRIVNKLNTDRKEIINKYTKDIADSENKLAILNRELDLSKLELLKIRKDIEIEKAHYEKIKSINKAFRSVDIITETSSDLKKIAAAIVELSNHEKDMTDIPTEYEEIGWKTISYIEKNRHLTMEKRYNRSKERLNKISSTVEGINGCTNKMEAWVEINKNENT